MDNIKSLLCDECGNHFEVSNKKYFQTLRSIKRHNCKCYCSPECRGKRVEFTCLTCNTQFRKLKSQIKRNFNSFCSSSCAATYNNTHKTKGTRRSKLEIWLEDQLLHIFPNLEILYSDKTTINSELDIYIPSFKLAFELNGIFHYEPIYGKSKLNQIQNNDNRKFQACLERGIELCIIDTSQHKYVKPSTSQKYLDIIVDIINNKIN